MEDPEKAKPKARAPMPLDLKADTNDSLRLLNRTPHPYLKPSSEIFEPSGKLVHRASAVPDHSGSDNTRDDHLPSPSFTKESSPTSDSGTEADDEHYLKGLPAPRPRLHKGLRGLSGTSTPLPLVVDEDPREISSKKKHKDDPPTVGQVLARRVLEVVILAGLGQLVASNPDVIPVAATWKKGMSCARSWTVSNLLNKGQSC